jgi:hypothetical protein
VCNISIITCAAAAAAAFALRHVQVLYQPSWMGCGKTLGEEGEQFFSYWSKFAPTTRNQSRAGVFLSMIHAFE